MRLRRSRRWISGLLLLWLGLLQFPLPFSVRATDGDASDGIAAKDRSTPFPCMNRPCGCQSAKECWTSCCCTTREERIAFVREYGLEMPDELKAPEIQPSQKSSANSCIAVSSAKPAHSCCQKKAPALTCEPGKSCETTSGCSTCTAKPAMKGKVAKTKTVMLNAVLKCKGLASQLALFSAAVVPVPAVPTIPSLECSGDAASFDVLLSGVTLSPPAPPPRIAA